MTDDDGNLRGHRRAVRWIRQRVEHVLRHIDDDRRWLDVGQPAPSFHREFDLADSALDGNRERGVGPGADDPVLGQSMTALKADDCGSQALIVDPVDRRSFRRRSVIAEFGQQAAKLFASRVSVTRFDRAFGQRGQQIEPGRNTPVARKRLLERPVLRSVWLEGRQGRPNVTGLSQLPKRRVRIERGTPPGEFVARGSWVDASIMQLMDQPGSRGADRAFCQRVRRASSTRLDG